jgi:FkbM family methyltransferase
VSFERIKSAIRALIPREARNWLRSPRKSAEWLWDDFRFRLGVTRTLHLPNGRTLICHPRVYRTADDAQLRDPEQSQEFRHFLSHCHKGMLLFDIGASFGIFSLAAADLGGRAVAVEPSSIAVNLIAAQVRLNGLADSIEVISAAAGETEGSVRMLSSGVFSDGYLRVVDGRLPRETTNVRVTTLDALKARFGTPSHIKIDVEGYEGSVLRGARKLLLESSPLIFLEIHNEMVAASGGNPNFSLDELLGLGYRIFSTSGGPISKAEALCTPITRLFASR